MKWLLLLLLTGLTSSAAQAAKDQPTYAGGMMVMGGGIAMEDVFGGMKGVNVGVGGRLMFMTGYGFRVGILGGTGKMTYGEHDSLFQYNHSAISAEWGMTRKRWTMNAGFTGGWAKYYILHKMDVSEDGLITAREYQKSVPIFSPFASFEFALSSRLRATLFVDYPFWPIEGHRHNHLRIGVGILFVK